MKRLHNKKQSIEEGRIDEHVLVAMTKLEHVHRAARKGSQNNKGLPKPGTFHQKPYVNKYPESACISSPAI
ncbi:unnamed protein product, partial [Mesorhabditis spiculigera]